MGKTVLATFRVDESKWKQFQSIAKDGGYSASAVLIGFIDRCIDSGIEAPPESTPVGIGLDLDRRIETYLDANLDRYLDKFIDRDDLQKIVNESIEVALESIEMKVVQIEKTLFDSSAHFLTSGNEDRQEKAATTPIERAVEGQGLTMSELIAKIGKTRQAIESARDKGALEDFGYRAEKNGRNWLYWAVDEER